MLEALGPLSAADAYTLFGACATVLCIAWGFRLALSFILNR